MYKITLVLKLDEEKLLKTLNAKMPKHAKNLGFYLIKIFDTKMT